jgi:hypothetical protein
MTREDFDSTIHRLLRQEPFQPFVVELFDGKQILIERPRLAVGGGGATMLTPDNWIEFECEQVREMRIATRETAS